MRTIRIRHNNGRFLADSSDIVWTSLLSEAAEYDSPAAALRDIEGEGIMACEIVTVDAAGNVIEEQPEPDLEEMLERAHEHGMDSEPDHEVGDLQDALRLCWAKLTAVDRREVFDKFMEFHELLDCEGCDGSGVRPESKPHSGPVPEGFVVVECCDACQRFADDKEAAIAWGGRDITEREHDVICRPPEKDVIWTDGTYYYHGACVDLDEDDVEWHHIDESAVPPDSACEGCETPINPTEDDGPNNCDECARSFGPHFRGPCEH